MKKRVLPNLLALFVFFYFTVLPFQQFNLNTNDIFGSKNIASAQLVYASTNVSLPTNTKDGTILHAFDWSFNSIKSKLPEIASAGYRAIQVSPVQASKATPNSSTWWNLYQPTNFSIGNSLGYRADFASLCSEAKKTYGIDIIVDVVMNHMANNDDGKNDGSQYYPWSGLDPMYKDNSSIWHAASGAKGINYANRGSVVFDCMDLPDLNTSNSTVQQWELGLMNDCVAAGAGGFRFDAAKHMATDVGQDANQTWSSNYWDVVLGSGLHNQSNLFVYGEVLQDDTNNTDNSAGYQKFMSVSASDYSNSVRAAVTGKDVSKANISQFCGVTPGRVVDYVETHDNYEHNETTNLSDWEREMDWAIIDSRAGSTPLFFARPSTNFGDASSDIWNNAEVTAANKFHNAMAGQNEYLRTQGSQVLIVDRGTIGTAIINLGGDTYINSKTNLANGTYTDKGTTSTTLTVSNGTITGNIPGGKAIYLYSPVPPTPTLTASANIKGGSYQTAQNVTLTASSSTASIYYTTDGTTPTAASSKYVSPIAISTNTTLKFLAVDGTAQSPVYTETYTFGSIGNAITVHYKNPSGWGAPNLYYYDVSKVLTSPAWPGVKMNSEGNSWYSYTIPNWSAAKVVFNDGKNQNPGVNQPGLDVTGQEWFENGTWYTSNPDAPTVSTNIKGGSYTSAQTVTLTATPTTASIYYTIDGTNPTTASTKYSAPISINSSTSLKFYAIDTQGNQSSIDTEKYTINLPVTLTVSANIKGGTYTSVQTVSLIASPTSANVYYTTDGSTPTVLSTKYSSPIIFNSSETLKFIAIDALGNQSAVGTEQYIINTSPVYSITVTANVNDVPSSTAKAITLIPSTTAAIYYTEDGTTPTILSAKYAGTFKVNRGTTVKYFAQDALGNQSEVDTLNINVAQIIIHFKKPSNWSAPNLYYYDAAGQLTSPAYPGIRMTSEGNDWYTYTIQGWTYATISFNDGTNQTPASGQAGYDVSGEKWIENGSIYSSNPDAGSTTALSGSSSLQSSLAA